MPLTYKAVIATFPGREKYLEESVESLRDQGVEPVIMCDERWGPPKWNEAIDNCETDLLFLPHDDDRYLPGFISETVAYMEAHPEVAACFTLDRFINSDGRRIEGGTDLLLPKQDTYDFETVLNSSLTITQYALANNQSGWIGNPLRCETVCLRPSLLGDMRYPMDAGCGKAIDTAFWFLILSKHPIGVIPKKLVENRQHTAQDTHAQRLKEVASHDHWKAIDYAISLKPDALHWDNYITLEHVRHRNKNMEEMERVKAKRDTAKVTLVVVHEPPDAAGTGVVAAHRVRTINGSEENIAYYVFPDPLASIHVLHQDIDYQWYQALSHHPCVHPAHPA